MGSAIRSITRLELESQCMQSSSAADIAELLSLLAPACPAVQQLQVAGDIRRRVFAALGASCNSLSCLQVKHGVTSEALQQLHLLLPRLTHCSIAAQLPIDAAAAEQCCLGLLSCSSLTHVNLGSRCLTPKMWRALPPGLRELQCSLECSPPTSTTFPNLQHVKCQYRLSDCDLELAKLVAFLRLAPELHTLLLSLNEREPSEDHSHGEISVDTAAHLAVPCSSGSIQDLLYLHERVMAGLAISSAFRGGGVSKGVNICMEDNEDDVGFQDDGIAGFLAMLPAMPAFSRLILWSMIAQPSFASITQGVTAAFPNITSLAIELAQTVTSENLTHLGALSALQHLYVNEAHVTTSSLIMLCNRMPHLKVLTLEECDVSVHDGEVLQSLLRHWGSTVKISVLS